MKRDFPKVFFLGQTRRTRKEVEESGAVDFFTASADATLSDDEGWLHGTDFHLPVEGYDFYEFVPLLLEQATQHLPGGGRGEGIFYVIAGGEPDGEASRPNVIYTGNPVDGSNSSRGP